MVGDYPAYDLVISARSVPTFLSEWNAGYARGGTLIERLVAVLLKAELENIPADGSNLLLYTWDLKELTNYSFLAGQFDSLCHGLTNPVGRTRACAEFTEVLREESLFPR